MSAVTLWIILSTSYGESVHLNQSRIFQKSHTAVVTVFAYINSKRREGTGFSIDPEEYEFPGRGEVRLGITAFDVVKDALKVDVLLYKDDKDDDGDWKNELCQALIYNVDIVRNVAILAILCGTCHCKRLGALQTRISDVDAGETVLVIGDLSKRRPHSFADGKLSYTNTTDCLACLTYKQIDATDKTFSTRVHGLIGSFNRGASGSAVLDTSGKVIGMTLAIKGDLKLCLSMAELLKAYKQRLKIPFVDYVGCTAHESAFLARTYWRGKSGKSISEMNALASATNAQYFALAHDEFDEAHAFTFHAPWWEIFPGKDHMIEDAAQCLGNDSFTDGYLLERTNEGELPCGCADNACRTNPNYCKRDGEDNDRRWAIFKRKGKGKYVPSDISVAMMENIAGESDYWQKKAGKLSEEKEDVASEYKSYQDTITVMKTVFICVVFALAWFTRKFYYCSKEVKKKLEQVTRERDELARQLQNLPQGIGAPVQEQDAL